MSIGIADSRLERLKNQIDGFECQHPKLEVRKLIASNGAIMFTKQCTRCGVYFDGWIPHKDVFEPENVMLIDDCLNAIYLQNKHDLERELQNKKRAAEKSDHVGVV